MISSWYIATRNKRKNEFVKIIDTSTRKHLTNFTDYIKQKLNRATCLRKEDKDNFKNIELDMIKSIIYQ